MSKQQVRRPPTKSEQRRDRREEQRRREQARIAAKRSRTMWIVGSIICAVGIIAIVAFMVLHNQSSPSVGSAATPNPTVDNSSLANPAVDNIQCNPQEQLAYHIHAHLSIYIDGQPHSVPQGIGIATDGSCYYWMHTHVANGVIHIESPQQSLYTLGNFLHLWGKQFPQLQYPSQLDSTDGWKVYVNGQPFQGDFNTIKLSPHLVITLAYNSPNAPIDSNYAWQPGE